ncbi:lytic transglycosylase domain-containing protein [uncultured Rhodoblastus sp.]|uniref:lytic transglycosylase domain-containing protein n=1 Tax=uncultured Rhodoblastus sp. TaxID=543037 RepID=UPI0026013652|nr:lytic transglycosylase domain-containing protein [uncultured Rhodoblastus sp.]
MMRRAALLGAAVATAIMLVRPASADELMIEACLKAAAEAHSVPAGVLVLLLDVERGRLGAVSPNSNKTVDIGPMQVNEIWVDKIAQRWKASKDAAYLALRDNFCANVEAGAWILRQALDEAPGNFWEGVAIYHSHNTKYKLIYLKNLREHAMRLRQRAIAGLERPAP